MRQAEDVSEQGGFRWFLVALFAAGFVGMLLRLALAPPRIEKLVRAKIETSSLRESLAFGSAEISLADGPFPDFALVLGRVEWRPVVGCTETAPVRARQVRVPLRFLSLLNGAPSVGKVKIDDLTIDLDDFKSGCGTVAIDVKASAAPLGLAATPVGEGADNSAKTEATVGVGKAKATPGEVWSTEDQQKVAAMVRGLRVSRAEIFFENRMKSVVLEDFEAAWRGEALDVATALKFPPSTVFGENLPAFAIRGTARRSEMFADIRADLSEGTLEAHAGFKPIVMANGSKELDAEVKLSVNDLPLSVVTPLLSKSGIVTGAFHPKFMWLDCNAEVRGVFSRLFVDYPVSLSECELSGQVGRLSFETATRLPSGRWKPFEVRADKVEIARILETVDVPGPTGVFANFGQVTGKLQLNSPDDATAKGEWRGAVLRFAGGDGAALQPVSVGKVEAKLAGRRWKAELADFKPDGGEADLKVDLDIERDGRDAKVDVTLAHLKLHSRVEKVIFTGPVNDIKGVASLTFQSSMQPPLAKMKAELALRGIQGAEMRADDVKIEAKTETRNAKNEIELTAKSPDVEVVKTGRLHRLLEPALFGWKGEDDDAAGLHLGKVSVKGRFRENGFQWQQANANIGSGMGRSTVALSSQGHIYRDHAIDSELEAHYPLASRLKWSISGTWLKPKFAAASPELGALFVKAGLPKETVVGVVPPRLLGVAASGVSSSAPSSVEPEIKRK